MYIQNWLLRFIIAILCGGFHALAGIFCGKYLYFPTGSIDWYKASIFIVLLMGIWWEYFGKPRNTRNNTPSQS